MNADKTEILSLNKCAITVPLNVNIKYLGNNVHLSSSAMVKICRNFLINDVNERYRLNVTTKIDALKKILLNWSRRNLTPNGKMMIIKCHALSQLTFVDQFQNISTADIKQIELLCYKFLWNGGPERVKRSTLKLSKLEGGIDGVDRIFFEYY